MSTGRMKDQKDFDLEQIVRIIDQALESDDQRIKDALRALMTVTVLCTAEHPDQAITGPLGRLQEDYNNLNRRVNMLEDEVRKMLWDQQKQKVEPFAPPYNPGSPFGPDGYPTTGQPKPMWGSSWSAGDDPGYKGASSSSNIDQIRELLSKREEE